MKKILILIGIVGVLALLPVLFDNEKAELDDSVRSGKPGSFMKLSDGIVHYEVGGPTSGQPVILVAGFSIPYFVFDHVFLALTNAGYRVVRFDLYGRGLSDRPATEYNLALFIRQIHGMKEALKLREPIDMVGSSMGGLITAAYISTYPTEIRRVAFLAPAGFPVKLPLLARAARLPGLGEYLIRVAGEKNIKKGTLAGLYGAAPAGFEENLTDQMKYIGFKHAMLSTLRNMPLESGDAYFKKVGEMKIKKMLVWGKQDKTLPFENNVAAREAMPGIEFHELDEAGHFPHFDAPEKIIHLLLKFLK